MPKIAIFQRRYLSQTNIFSINSFNFRGETHHHFFREILSLGANEIPERIPQKIPIPGPWSIQHILGDRLIP